MKRVLVVIAAVAGLVNAAGPARSAPSHACDDVGSWIAGTVEICDGALVYRDYVYDDYGADSGVPGAKQYDALANTKGDVRYADHGQAENTADLLRLTLRVEGGQVRVEALLNTVFAPDAAVLTVAIDGATWSFAVADPETNTISGSFPQPSGDRWHVQAWTAIKDGPITNVAFRGTDESGVWWEDGQAAALAANDISAYATDVDVADLRRGVDRPATPVPGFFERVYTSAITIGPALEGVSYDGVPGRVQEGGTSTRQAFHFFGTHQPYGIYVPPGDGAHGLQLALHGRSANHSSLIANRNLQVRFGDDLDRIILTPLGRGPTGMYSEESERDVLDAWDDVTAHYDVDPDRVVAGGYSMGGYGALRLATLHPDRFAGLVDWVGPSGDAVNGTPLAGRSAPNDGYVGNPLEMLENLRHVPTAMLYAGEDELVHVNNGIALEQRLAELGYEHILWFHPLAEHLTFALLDDWRKEAAWSAGRTRVVDPSHVVYRVDRAIDSPNPALGLVYDHAYWVRDIAYRTQGETVVDARSFGCARRTDDATAADPPGAGIDPVPWVSRSWSKTGTSAVPQANRLELTVANVASLTIDVRAACIKRGPTSYAITSDGPVVVHLSDGRVVDTATMPPNGML